MGINSKTRFEVLERDNFACWYCGRTPPDVKLHVDHVYPKSKGGPDEHGNLVAACEACNYGKSARVMGGNIIALIKSKIRRIKSSPAKSWTPPPPHIVRAWTCYYMRMAKE